MTCKRAAAEVLTICSAICSNVVSASQVYGYQSMKEGASSEQILGRVAKEAGQQTVLGTKFFTVRLLMLPI